MPKGVYVRSPEALAKIRSIWTPEVRAKVSASMRRFRRDQAAQAELGRRFKELDPERAALLEKEQDK